MSALVDEAELAALIRECFTGLGLAADDAWAIAEACVYANLRGVDSHGFARVPAYMRKVHAGLAGGTEGMSTVADGGVLCRLDAGRALGPAAAVKGVDLAMELAHRHGVGLVAVGNSTHFGAAGFYVRRAALRRLIAVAATNGPANMAPHGAAEPFLGTNAIAVGAPVGRHGEFVLDMSSSIAARGRILRAEALGMAIEPGLAIDADGRPTTDARAALAGAVLPFAGAKGSGLAFAVCMAAGVLAGAGFDDEVAPMHGDSDRPQNVGHVFAVIDPWRLADPAEALARVERLVDRLHGLRPADGFDRVRFAGERGDDQAAERRAGGIPIAAGELEAVARACEDCGLSRLADRVRLLPA